MAIGLAALALGLIVATAWTGCSSGSSTSSAGGDGVPSGSGSCASPYRGSCDNPGELHCTDVRGSDATVVPRYDSNCRDEGGSWSTNACSRGNIGGCMVDRSRTNDCVIVWGPYNKQPTDPPATPASVEADCAKLRGVFLPP